MGKILSRIKGQPWKEHGKCFAYCFGTLYFLLWITFEDAVYVRAALRELPFEFFTEAGKRTGVVAVLLVELFFLPWICKRLSKSVWIIGMILLMLGLIIPSLAAPLESQTSSILNGNSHFNVYTIVTGLALLGCFIAKFLATMTVYGVKSDGASA